MDEASVLELKRAVGQLIAGLRQQVAERDATINALQQRVALLEGANRAAADDVSRLFASFAPQLDESTRSVFSVSPVKADSPPEKTLVATATSSTTPVTPLLQSHLSASDGSLFQAAIDRRSANATLTANARAELLVSASVSDLSVVAPLPKAQTQTPSPSASPVPLVKREESSILQKARVHLNDVHSLAVRQRRRQSVSTPPHSETATMSLSSSGPLPLQMPSSPSPPAQEPPLRESGNHQGVVRPQLDASLKESMDETVAGVVVDTAEVADLAVRGGAAIGGTPPMKRKSAGSFSSPKGTSPPTNDAPPPLAGAKLPPTEFLRDVLSERSISTGSATGSANAGVLSSLSSMSSVNRTILKRFKSVFPRESARKSLESHKDFAPALDGGFFLHGQRCGGKPMFAPGPGGGYVVEAYSTEEESGEWQFAPESLTVPACFRLVFDARMSACRPKVWAVYGDSPCYIFAAPGNDTPDAPNVLVFVFGPHGIQKTTVCLPNASVMSSLELGRHLLSMANSLIPVESVVRLRNMIAEGALKKLKDLEARLVPQVFEVGLIDLSPDTESSGRGGRNALKLSRRNAIHGFTGMLQALAKTEEPQTGAIGDTISYTWEGIEIRMVVSNTLGSVRDVVLCFMPEDAQPLKMNDLRNAQVVICCREIPQQQPKYQLACGKKSDVPSFGPPFFSGPVAAKNLQSLVTAKILHAVASLRSMPAVSKKIHAEMMDGLKTMQGGGSSSTVVLKTE